MAQSNRISQPGLPGLPGLLFIIRGVVKT